MFRVDTFSAWPGDTADAAAGLTAILAAARRADWRVIAHASSSADLRTALQGFAACDIVFDQRDGIECRHMPEPAQLRAIAQLGLSLGLTANERGETVPEPGAWRAIDLPVPPISLALDAAAGPSAPLRMAAYGVDLGLTVAESLAAVTIDAARRCGAGEILGSLERGKYADLVFLKGDPRALAAPDLATLGCTGTWVHGHET